MTATWEPAIGKATEIFMRMRQQAQGEPLVGPPMLGDMLSTDGRLGVYHLGICVDQDSQEVVHASKRDRAVVRTSLHEFTDGGNLRLVVRAAGLTRYSVALRAEQEIGKEYKLFTRNCEQVASLAFDGRAASPQVGGVTILLGGLAKDLAGIYSLFAQGGPPAR